MSSIPVEQAIYRRVDGGPPRLVAHSAGFADEWLAEAERLVIGFGDRPPGVACPAAVFAQPLGRRHVAIVQVADDAGSALRFRFLVVPRADYAAYYGDPFAVADFFPPKWEEKSLPALSLPAEPLPPRTVEQVREVLKRVKAYALAEGQNPEAYDDWEGIDPELAQSPALLGGVQILVDGGRVVFERPGPDERLMRGLWTLLPTSTRSELWPASYAFGNALRFDAVTVPEAKGRQYEGYATEDQAADTPQGSYELSLQVAAETGDQAQLDALLARRSWAQTWRLGLVLLAVMIVLVILSRWSEPTPDGPTDRPQRAATAASILSSGDPWLAAAQLQAGHARWGKQP